MLPSPSQVEYKVANVGDIVGALSAEEDDDAVAVVAIATFMLWLCGDEEKTSSLVVNFCACLLFCARRVTCANRRWFGTALPE